jgi:type IV secretory pathway TraG/TraD family ATPase VirD4
VSRTLGPRADVTADPLLPLVVALAVGVPGVGWWLATAGRAASWLSGNGWTGPAPSLRLVHSTVTDGPSTEWPSTPGWLVAAVFLAGLAAVTTLSVLAWSRWAGGRADESARALATRGDVAALTPAGVAGRTHRLRPSLAGTPARKLGGADCGVTLGRLVPRGPVLRASWEDVVLAVMAPRAGKTTALAVPAVLDAPGAVVATSNKADLWAATAALREQATGERVWVFDPQAIAHVEQTWWWNPLAAATTVDEAHRLAGHFVQEIVGDKGRRDFWVSAAHDLLTALLLAAAADQRTLLDVYSWLNDPSLPTPADLLRQHGYPAAAAALIGRQNGAPETRDGVYETARTAAQVLRDPRITAWVTPPDCAGLGELDLAGFATSRQTLLLLTKDGAGAAAPLVAAMTDRVMRDAVRQAERRGGRLDPPMVAVLDEAANVCRIADLPDLYSHLGSRGVLPVTVLQSYRQGVRVWGEAGMDAMWSAATVKVIGAGIDDPKLAEDLSRLIGDHDVTVRSVSSSRHGSSTSTSLRRQRILPAEQIRALPRGRALVFATGSPAALVDLQPWYAGPRAAAVRDAVQVSEAGLTVRAQQHLHERGRA